MSPILSIKNFTVRREGKVVVDDVSLDVRAGELHILMGPNGSGKSTLLNALMGHPAYEVVGGEMLLDGEDLAQLSTEKKAARGLFLSPQHAPKVDGVTMLAFLHRAYRIIKKSEISVPYFYNKLTTKVKEFGFEEGLLKRFVNVGFSGGEKKQGEMIQLLALEPRFALLDEIDSGVDVDSLKNVFGTIEKLRVQGVGFLLVTHLGTVLEHVTPDRVSVMRDGKIVRTGDAALAREILTKGFENI
ncbi:MAG: Fe-S cluster assembly ATPase SufC [Patescibacteria group bacterium]